MNEQQIIEHGNQAKSILEHPLFINIVKEYENRLVNNWKLSNPDNSLEREHLWLEYNTLKKVITELNILLQSAYQVQLQQDEQE